jgi:hypothetical protein
VPVSAEDSGLNRLIEELSNANPATRASAAAEIFRCGFDVAHAAVALWLLDAQLAGCLCLSETGGPKATVGIAVERGTFDRIRAANGSPRLANVPDDQDAEEFELDFPGGVRLDILTTRQAGAGGAIDKFLRRFGEGIQQVEFETRDVGRATEILRSRFGIAPIYPQTRAGADGTRVNFFLVPAAPGKLLIELVETPGSLHES